MARLVPLLSFYTSEWDQEPDLPWCPEQQLLRCAFVGVARLLGCVVVWLFVGLLF